MSSQPKDRRGRLTDTAKTQEFFLDSPDEEHNQLDEEYMKLGELCQKESFNLKSKANQHSPPKQKKKPQKKEIQKARPKSRSRDKKESGSDMSSSQYQPESFGDSQSENEDSYDPSERFPENDVARHLKFLIRKFQTDLSNQQTKEKKIRQLANGLDLTVQGVRQEVSNFFRRRKTVRPDSRFEHQTIYKKTEMFDDAIRRVLKTTPYACINDLREEIKQKLDLDLAKQTLIRRLKNLKYHYKKFTICKQENNDAKTIELRRGYLKIYRQILQKKYPILFYGTVHMALDECRGSMWMKSKLNGQIDHILCEKDVLTITLILSTERIEFYAIYQGFYKQQIFTDAIKDWLSKIDSGHQSSQNIKKRQFSPLPAYLIIEGNLIHCKQGRLNCSMTELLLQHSVMPIPFPCGSSSMNPAQVLFNQIKYVARGKVKRICIKQLQQCVETVIENHIDLEDIRFAFRKVQEINKKY